MIAHVFFALAVAAAQIPADYRFTIQEDAKFRVGVRVNVLAYCGKSNVGTDVEIINKTDKRACISLDQCRAGSATTEVADSRATRMTDGAICTRAQASARRTKEEMIFIEPGSAPGGYSEMKPFYETAVPALGVFKPMPAKQSYAARVRIPILLDCEAAFAACGPTGCDWAALEKAGKVHIVEFKGLKVFDLGNETCPSE